MEIGSAEEPPIRATPIYRSFLKKSGDHTRQEVGFVLISHIIFRK